MHGELGQWDRAAADYTTIIELGAADYNVLVQRGSVYSVMRQWDRAIADYTRAIDLGVRYVWDWRGSAHAELGRWDEAAADFARAIEVGDAPGEAWYHRALVLLKQGDRQGYRTLCTDMLKRFDRLRNPRAFANMVGALLLAPGAIADPKRLPDLTEQALTNDLPDFDAGLMQGAALYRANQVDTAVERLKEAVTVKREAPAAWFFLAMAQHRLGKAGEARQAFDRAVQATDRAAAGKPPLSWDERLILELLRREAEALLGMAP
jgi:tetratricopeptide (TPR) repeat protein